MEHYFWWENTALLEGGIHVQAVQHFGTFIISVFRSCNTIVSTYLKEEFTVPLPGERLEGVQYQACIVSTDRSIRYTNNLLKNTEFYGVTQDYIPA